MRGILTAGLRELGLNYTEAAVAGFEKYADHLSLRNEVMNLTAITDRDDIARLHFLDCAALLSQYSFPQNCKVIDVGTGAGFPGVPLKLLRPDINLTLLDSQRKRIGFLEELCAMLELPEVSCIWARAEEAALQLGAGFDVAVSRAVAQLNILCELCLPFVRTGGVFIAMKGPDCSEEVAAAKKAIRLLGGSDPEIKRTTIPGTDIVHSAVIIEKKQPTSRGYPRPFGKIKKSPL